MRRFIATISVLLAVATMSFAALLGQRIAPKGTFRGDPAVLIAVARHNPEVQADYAKRLGKSWNQPGVLRVIGKKDIPDGALVPNNAVMIGGKLKHINTYQRGNDVAFLVENILTGQKSWMKSCCQTFDFEIPSDWRSQPIYLETELEISAEANARAMASATSSSTSSARGGNATLIFNNPQPRFLPQQRVLTTTGRETITVASVYWAPQVKINNKIDISNQNVNVNTLNQSQSQSQSQAQAQSQAQSLANSIGL